MSFGPQHATSRPSTPPRCWCASVPGAAGFSAPPSVCGDRNSKGKCRMAQLPVGSEGGVRISAHCASPRIDTRGDRRTGMWSLSGSDSRAVFLDLTAQLFGPLVAAATCWGGGDGSCSRSGMPKRITNCRTPVSVRPLKSSTARRLLPPARSHCSGPSRPRLTPISVCLGLLGLFLSLGLGVRRVVRAASLYDRFRAAVQRV